jgi:endoglucanase
MKMQYYSSSSSSPVALLLLCACILLCSSSLLVSVEAADDYCQVLHQSLVFYEANRAGRLPTTERVPWRGNSALGDCTAPCTKDANGDGNLEGGYYDAGDHVKFGLPMAWTTTTLAWGLIESESAVNACGELSYYLETIKWATDYFIKAHISPNEFVAQVGNGGTDHSYWGPSETMTMDRPVYTLTSSLPGTEVAMETAAAMAAAAIVFNGRAGYEGYSTTLLTHARQLFTFGDTYRGVYSDSIPDAANYYKSWSGYNDEIVWAAAWLYRATGEQPFLARAESGYSLISGSIVGQSFDWDNKAPGAAALLAKITASTPYTEDAKKFLNWWKPGGGVSYTPGGLAWMRQWGPNRYAANAAFIATVMGGEYATWAQGQISYMLGNNPLQRSYVCGYGYNYPINPHHRGAHGSTTNDINNPVNNLHVLYGALVGGPDQADGYSDDRTDYIKNEVATDYNAGFTGAIAALAGLNSATPVVSSPSAPVASVPIAAATSAPVTPSTPSTGSKYIYSDTLAPGVMDWSWAVHNTQSATYTHSNSQYSISFEPDVWAGVFLKCDTCIDITQHTGVELYISGGANVGQQVRAYLVTVENGSTVQIGQAVSVTVGSAWSRVLLDLTQLTKPVIGVIVQDTTGADQATVYVDDFAVLLK